MLPVSLNCPFLIARSVFYNVYLFCFSSCCQFLWIVHSWLPVRYSITFICFVFHFSRLWNWRNISSKVNRLIHVFIYQLLGKTRHTCFSLHMSPVQCLEISWPVIENFIWIEPLLRGHLSYKATFMLSQRWPLNTGLTVYIYLTLSYLSFIYIHILSY